MPTLTIVDWQKLIADGNPLAPNSAWMRFWCEGEPASWCIPRLSDWADATRAVYRMTVYLDAILPKLLESKDSSILLGICSQFVAYTGPGSRCVLNDIVPTKDDDAYFVFSTPASTAHFAEQFETLTLLPIRDQWDDIALDICNHNFAGDLDCLVTFDFFETYLRECKDVVCEARSLGYGIVMHWG